MKKMNKSIPYPQNVMMEIFVFYDEDKLNNIINFVINNLDDTIEYAINNFLTKMQKDVFELRFKGFNTYREIGEKLGISNQRSRQIVAKVIRELRRPGFLKVIYKGYSNLSKEELEKLEKLLKK